jgi:DHA3 family macrolide efflux protein-like MFS transporter
MAKVAPDVQGRVFATRRMIVQIVGPLGMLIAGPLADMVFEPGLMPGGALVNTFGGVFGIGPGAGMALLIVITGALQAAFGLAGYASRAVRNVESTLPDHDSAVSVPEVEVPAAV